MPKANILFFLNVGYKSGSFILSVINFGPPQDTILPAGTYTFWLSGGCGGKGSGSTAGAGDRRHDGINPGKNSRELSFQVELLQQTTITSYIGKKGEPGKSGNEWQHEAAGNGGGGGGLSYFTTSAPIKIDNTEYNIFWCAGGPGGKGGDYYWTGLSGTKYEFKGGGNGGKGGTYVAGDSSTSPPKNGTGENGGWGVWAEGVGGAQGIGGTGYAIKGLQGIYENANYANRSNKSDFPDEFEPGLDGYLYIRKDD
ncbi:hypothetical protein AGMMS49991_05100 [Spirochaetia bacterium]|nr:hypothetical protein AGMMS49991_05100 [Spirochaetia bacterium]